MDFYAARVNMVKAQVAPNKVHEPELLDGLMVVARERFVAPDRQDLAYSDCQVVMGETRRLLKPLQSAQLIRALAVKPKDRILVVGAGTGFEVAVLEKMGAMIFALESDPVLADKGKTLTASETVRWQTGRLDQGWPEESPFDGILFAGAVAAIPDRLVSQLTGEGVLVAIVGREGAPVMTMTRITGSGGARHPESLLETVADLLPGMGPSGPFEL